MLKFRLQRDGEEDYIVRSQSSCLMSRAVNTEITLDPGLYHVLMKVTAYRQRDVESTEEVVRRLAPTRREKLVQIGLSHDLAHAKGLVVETEKERQEREEGEDRRRTAERRRLRDETEKRLQKEWIRDRKLEARRARAEARRQRDKAGQHDRRNDGMKRENGTSDSITSGGIFQSPTAISDDLEITSANGSLPTIHIHSSKPSDGRSASPCPSLDGRLTTDGVNPRDAHLLEGFEFDSDLDMPPEEPAAEKAIPEPAPRGYLGETSGDPWNAVCVVGLRVYSKDPHLSLQVICPVPEDNSEAALDRDDPAASATNKKSSSRRTSI